ncbi:MAG: hypothetical protein Phog2KO_33180 [Phototrophicaceae bacterium]
MSNLIGQIIRNYKIEDFIGQGGHGTVYRAINLVSDEVVAIKIMLTEHLEDKTMIQRIIQEADIIGNLQHPNIVPLIEFWQDDGGIYLVMPWYSGGDLRAYIKENQPIQPQMLSNILTQICDALDHAHAVHIIHRDIKPENILLDNKNNAYLSDFGFAKRTNNSVNITTVGDVVGTANYLSPEQIMGYDIGNKTDIYALGIVIHEILDGAHPYANTNSRIQLMLKMVQEDLPDLKNTTFSAEVLAQINTLIRRCTAKNPDDRYLRASDVAQDFTKIIQSD